MLSGLGALPSPHGAPVEVSYLIPKQALDLALRASLHVL